LETVVEFNITSISGPAGASKKQMDEAVVQGKAELERMKPIPLSLNEAQVH
jgi:hypothetical protein